METNMKHIRILLLAVSVFVWHGAANAQAAMTPGQIQALIASGQEQAALAAVHAAVQAHPESGVAWYLTAEAQDAAGNEAAAQAALTKAEQFAPGLPFANQQKVAALQAHISGPAPAQGAMGHGVSPLVFLIGAVVIFLLFRMFIRRRRGAGLMPMQSYRPGFDAPMPFGQPGPMTGYNQGGGLGSSLLGGLAAGAGFAAGERIIDDVMGGGRAPDQPVQGVDPAPPTWDDGLNGSPGWDDDQNNGGFDQGGGW
jgi:hypothetical protein